MREKPMRLASKLKAIRQRLGLSQTEMVQRLKFKGQYGRISEYELGTSAYRVNDLVVCASGQRINGISR